GPSTTSIPAERSNPTSTGPDRSSYTPAAARLEATRASALIATVPGLALWPSWPPPVPVPAAALAAVTPRPGRAHHASGRAHHAPGRAHHASGRAHHAPGRAHHAPGRAHHARTPVVALVTAAVLILAAATGRTCRRISPRPGRR